MFFKSTERGLEMTVIKITITVVKENTKIIIKEKRNYKNLEEDLNVRLKVTFFQVNYYI